LKPLKEFRKDCNGKRSKQKYWKPLKLNKALRRNIEEGERRQEIEAIKRIYDILDMAKNKEIKEIIHHQ
jgi:hypothetical protein